MSRECSSDCRDAPLSAANARLQRLQVDGLAPRRHHIQSLDFSFSDLITEDAAFGMISKEVLVAKTSEHVPSRTQYRPSHKLPSG